MKTRWFPRSYLLTAVLCLSAFGKTNSQEASTEEFKKAFADCSWDSAEFDKCVKDAINSVRDPFFKIGVPALNITPFDPWHVDEVIQTRGGPSLNYRLKLKNVYERGWSDSIITKFKSNRNKRSIQYTQYFPQKALDGEYEFEGSLMASNMANAGKWNLTLYDYIQTTTLSKPLKSDKIKLRIEVQQIGNMDLHISNLLRGRTIMENMMDRIINTAWRPGFAVIKPLINDIVSTAFTKIFNDIFNDLDLNQIIPG